MRGHVSRRVSAWTHRAQPGWMGRPVRPLIAALGLTVLVACPTTAQAGGLTLNLCGSFGAGAMSPSVQTGLTAADRCPGGALEISASRTTKAGTRAAWQATAPAGIAINHFWIGNGSLDVNGVNDGTGYGGGFYWQGGSAQAGNAQTGYSSPTFSSSVVGWQMACGSSSCPNTGSFIRVYQVQLQATENTGPGLVATTPLWYTTGWIRGLGRSGW